MLERDTEVGLSIHQLGNSEGVVIPAEWRRRLEIDSEEAADAEADFEERSVTFYF